MTRINTEMVFASHKDYKFFRVIPKHLRNKRSSRVLPSSNVYYGIFFVAMSVFQCLGFPHPARQPGTSHNFGLNIEQPFSRDLF
jgi:hypothetical protein